MLRVLTVVYHENEVHFNMALKAWKAFEDCEIVAVVNKRLEGVEYPDHIHYIENDENCLAGAWNIGLKYFFEKSDEPVFVSGLDSIAPSNRRMQNMINTLSEDKMMGLMGATPSHRRIPSADVQHGDGTFSFYLISKYAFETVGDFDERYTPAYFEDSDYLERLWKHGFKPFRTQTVTFIHVEQGTIKHGPDVRAQYAEFMNKNLQIFRDTYGKVPNHLSDDIVFK